MKKAINYICILFTSIIISSTGFSQLNNTELKKYSFEGLNSLRDVNSIIQDEFNYLWFSNINKIVKYDGHQFHTVASTKMDLPNRISEYQKLFIGSNYKIYSYLKQLMLYNYQQNSWKTVYESKKDILSLTEDNNNNIWFVTIDNLLKFDANTLRIDTIISRFNKPEEIPEFVKIEFCPPNKLFIGTQDGAIIDFNISGSSSSFKIVQLVKKKQWQIIVPSYVSNLNEMWFICQGINNVWVLDYETGQYNHLTIVRPEFKPFIKYLSHNSITYNLSDTETWFYGSSKIISYKNGVKPEVSIINTFQAPKYITKDNTGITWVGGSTVFTFNPYNNHDNIKTLQHSNESDSFNGYVVTSLIVDKDNNTYAGIANKGLMKSDISFKNFSYYSNEFKPHYILGNILDIEKIDNFIFLGQSNLNIYNTQDKSFAYSNPDKDNPKNLNHWANWALEYGETSGNLWIGSINGGAWIDSVDLQNYLNNFKPGRIPDIFNTMKAPNNGKNLVGPIWDILEDINGNVWIAHNDGLIFIEYITGNSILYSSNDLNYKPYVNQIRCFYQSKDGKIWLGKEQNGIYYIDPNTKEFHSLQNFDYEQHTNIKSIIEDNTGNIWMGTPSGLLCYNLNKEYLSYYNKDDGFISDDFFLQSVTKDKYGKLYFGTYDGITYFDPNEIKQNPSPASPRITGISVGKQKVQPGLTINGQKILYRSIEYTNEIKLDYKNNTFRLDFSAMLFDNSSKNKFKYFLEGYDKNEAGWISTNSKTNYAKYSNVPPGKYLFNLKASNNNMQWSTETAKLKIIIMPPYYKTWWFSLILAAIIFILLWAYVRLRTIKIKRRNIELSTLVDERTKEIEDVNLELKKANATKDKFFSIIGHDLRNPFQGILNASMYLLSKYDSLSPDKAKFIIKTINDSSSTAHQLLENLLNWSRSQSKKLEPKNELFHIDEIITSVIVLLRINAEQKNIKFIKNIEAESVINSDKNMLLTVVRNLLNNAIKFSNIQSEIIIATKIKNEQIHISIKDEGKGMSEQFQKSIFNKDNNTSLIGTKGEKGTGLGLIICKDFIEMLDGTVSVESKLDKGSTFTISLPYDPSITIDYKGEYDKENEITDKELNLLNEHLLDKNKDQAKPIALVIEDDVNIRENLVFLLNNWFKVEDAENGEIGIQKALKIIPDIVISDVDMPIKNGFEVCHTIKSDQSTSHIPVILLTALNTEQEKMTGLQTGADDYITKPFNPSILIIRIKNLIQSRKDLKRLFSKEINISPEEYTVSAADASFIQKAIDYVEENISNENLSLDKLADFLNMSRPNLYRKIKAITDISPGDFVRTIRLKRAAKLLLEGQNITYTIDKTGFTDPSHFSRVFKKHFGMTPLEFAEKRDRKEFDI